MTKFLASVLLATGTVLSGAASAAVTVYTVEFSATDFFVGNGYAGGVPVDPVSGSFTFTIDPERIVVGEIGDVTVNYLNIPVSFPVGLQFSLYSDDGPVLWIGGSSPADSDDERARGNDPAGMAFVGLFDDFRLGIANPWTSPALHVASDDGGRPDLQGFLYSIVGPFNYFSTRNVELTMTATPLAAAVPEPAAWLTMLAGFGLVGAGLRGRRRAAIPA